MNTQILSQNPIKIDNSLVKVIIEGSYQDNWRTLHYKLAKLPIEKETTHIINNGESYLLHGEAGFPGVFRSYEGSHSTICEIKESFWKGGRVYGGDVQPDETFLQRARAMITETGNVYIAEFMLNEEQYIQSLPTILRNTITMFADKEVLEEFDQF